MLLLSIIVIVSKRHTRLLWVALLIQRCGIHELIVTVAFIGSDFPIRFSISNKPVEMTFEESSTSFPLNGPEGDEVWSSLIPDSHLGYVRLGPDRRIFAIAMFHELHCVNIFRTALDEPDGGGGSRQGHHVQHCLNYLRQLFLCSADHTLEPYDFLSQNLNYTKDGIGATRECRDWKAVYEGADLNYREWMDFFQKNATYSSSTCEYFRLRL